MARIGSKHRVMPVVSSKRGYWSLKCVLRPFTNHRSSKCSWEIISFPWNMIICIETWIVIGNSFMILRPSLAFRGGTLWFRCNELWFCLWDLCLHLEERLCNLGAMTWRPVPTLFRWMNSLDLENLDHDKGLSQGFCQGHHRWNLSWVPWAHLWCDRGGPLHKVELTVGGHCTRLSWLWWIAIQI